MPPVSFSKATPQQARLKMMLYADAGCGKTATALLFAEGLAKKEGKRIAYIDTEHGTDFYAQAVPQRTWHPAAFDFDAIYTRSLADVIGAVRGLDFRQHGVVVIDSLSHLWEAAIEAYQGKLTRADTIPIQAWGAIKKPFKGLIRFLLENPVHFVLCAREANTFDRSDEGEWNKTGVKPQTEGKTKYEPHIVGRMECVQSKEDSTRSTYLVRFEKDRTGVLGGRTIANPSFSTIEPLLPLLGTVQATTEDPDDVAERDGALIDESDEKSVEKEARSRTMLADFHAKIAAAASLDDLAKVAGELKVAKKKMLAAHVDSLRSVYETRATDLSKLHAPATI